MGEITIASTSDTPNQVREALGLEPVKDNADPGQNPFVVSADIRKTEEATTVTETFPDQEAAPPPPAPPTETDDDDDDDEMPDKEAASQAGRTLAKAKSFQGRLGRMKYEANELKNKLSAKDAETAELRSRLEALESGRLTVNPNPQPQALPPPPEQAFQAPPAAPTEQPFAEPRPKSDDFPDYEAYELAKEDWLVRKVNHERDQKELVAETRRRTEYEEQRRQQAIEEGMKEATKKWEEGRTRAKEKYPDFDEVFESAKQMPVAQAAVVAIQHSEMAPELTYFLATHPEEVERINKLPPGGIWTELGKLEVKLELGLIGGASDAPAAAARPIGRIPVSKAPAPVTRVGSGAGVQIQKDPEKMSFAEHKAWRAQGGGR